MHPLALISVPMSLAGVYLMADPEMGGLNLGDWLTIACAAAFALQMVSLEAASGGWMMRGADLRADGDVGRTGGFMECNRRSVLCHDPGPESER
jgi:hypothetical protein